MINNISQILKSAFRRIEKGKGNSRSWNSLCTVLSYRFKDDSLLQQAMTHRSYLSNSGERWESNERLEFLGDAVLGLVVTDELYRLYPRASEGQLTRVKASVVSRERLAKVAHSIKLGRYILLGGGEEKSGGRDRDSILSDALEALLGALYLDGGEACIRRIVKKYLLKNLKPVLQDKFHRNFKSWLLETVQGEGRSSPRYRVLEESGPDHKKRFTVQVSVEGEILGQGIGLSKKKAEQEAAHNALVKMELIES